jgi:hypothetical protein
MAKITRDKEFLLRLIADPLPPEVIMAQIPVDIF